jgi:lipooligosaccharide transport system permease protein
MAATTAPTTARKIGNSVTRVLPFGSRHAVHILERNRFIFRRGWMVIFSGFFEPVFFLLGIGFGLGSLIGNVSLADGTQMPYAVFVAPALLATAAMNGAVYDSTNMFFRLRYEKAYDGMLATPMNVGDIALGEVVWALGRGSLYGLGFLAVMFAFGLVPSAWGVLALPASMLIGFATAAAGLAATTFMRSWQDLDLLFVVTLPLFLFSGTFFPVTTYPEPLRTIVEFSPLYRGVDLVRSLTTGTVSWVQLVDVVYLGAMGLLFVFIASRRLRKMLIK